MNTIEWPGLYHLNRQVHGEVCRTYELEINGCERTVDAEHAGLELWRIRDGSQSLRIRGKETTARPGQVFLFNGREPHSELHKKNRNCRADIVVIRADWLRSITDELGFNVDEMVFDEVAIAPSSALVRIISDLFSLRQTPEFSTASLDCIVSALSLNLLLNQSHCYSGKMERFLAQGRFPSSFLKAKAIMRDMASSQVVDLQEIARLAGMSKFHFLRHFKEHVGVSPMQYLASIKLDIAKNRIVANEGKVIEAAFESGFRDLSTFNKAFRRHTGTTPSGFRRRHGIE